MKGRIFRLLFFLARSTFVVQSTSSLGVDEFLYPVASVQVAGQEKLYLFYQKSLSHTELWSWDPETKDVSKALLSTYTPAGLKVLPGQHAFSFIDNGRIKVKFFNKRSPKSLDIYEPIYDIGYIEWIDDFSCYFSAKEHNRCGIFQANMRGELERIVTSNSADCMYPQKIDDQLFYIERLSCNQGYRYRIVQLAYPSFVYDKDPSFNSDENFDKRVRALLESDFQSKKIHIDESQKIEVIDFGERPIAFLHMISISEGFCVEHPFEIDRQDKTMIFHYHHILKKDAQWILSYLFSFEIPLHFLLPDSPSRLYESVLPLLPRVYYDNIFFVDCSKNNFYNLDLYNYNRTSGTCTLRSQAKKFGQNFFTPYNLDDHFYYGGSLMKEEGEKKQPQLGMILDNNGHMFFDLLKL